MAAATVICAMTVAPPRPTSPLSRRMTDAPCRAAAIAAYIPAPPAPTIRTSVARWRIILRWRSELQIEDCRFHPRLVTETLSTYENPSQAGCLASHSVVVRIKPALQLPARTVSWFFLPLYPALCRPQLFL